MRSWIRIVVATLFFAALNSGCGSKSDTSNQDKDKAGSGEQNVPGVKDKKIPGPPAPPPPPPIPK